jgi:hypothetical protein
MAFVEEAVLQAMWQPSLCMPWILQHHRGASTRVTKHTTIGSKLFHRYRKRLHNDIEQHTKRTKHAKAIHQLYSLGSFKLARFKTSRLLRSRDGPDDDIHLYYLFRLCKHLDVPYCNRAQREITKIMLFRQLPLPSPAQPLRICFLAHNSFERAIRRLLIDFVARHKAQWLPLHWPSSEVAEGKHITIADTLHNWKQAMREWQWRPPTSCNCTTLLQRFPDLPRSGEHIAGGLVTQYLPAHLQFLSNTCTKDGCFRPKTAYIEHGVAQLKKWLPPMREHLYDDLSKAWRELIEVEWPKHLEVVRSTQRFQVSDVNALRQYLPGVIFHNEDHHPHKLCIYCPILYHGLILKTFHDIKVFNPIHCSPVVFRNHMLDQCPGWIRQRYSWGLRPNGSLPYAYVLPKGKKGFTSARPIIASRGGPLSILMQALGKLLADILPLAYPGTYGYRTMAQILRDIHRFLAKPGNLSEHYSFHNDDLKGFFTSVPHFVIIESAVHLVSTYNHIFPPKHGEDTVFTVKINSTSKERSIRGRSFKHTSKNHIMRLADIPALVHFALKNSAFKCMDLMFQQDRGAIIGGHASPSICSMAVAYREFVWARAYQIAKHADMLCVRYVDNRLTIISKSLERTPPFSRFCNLLFYEAPIELENCGDNVLLGYRIDLTTKTCHYVVPEQAYFYRSPRSAGTTRRILSGLNARLHLLYRGTFPRTEARNLVSQLFHGYVQQGFHLDILKRIAFKINSRYM